MPAVAAQRVFALMLDVRDVVAVKAGANARYDVPLLVPVNLKPHNDALKHKKSAISSYR
jgi:hypothetical protein